jgi:hypothetical protein
MLAMVGAMAVMRVVRAVTVDMGLAVPGDIRVTAEMAGEIVVYVQQQQVLAAAVAVVAPLTGAAAA